MRIHKYTFIDNLISLIIAGLLSEFLLFAYLFNIISDIKDPEPRITPIYEKITEYADDDPPVVKDPPDIIEETEDEIIEEIEEEIIILPNLMLTSELGRVQGPQNEESWYNLPMHNVINKMRSIGYTEADYLYYVREDGVKMLGDFIMIAANLSEYPRGTVVQTSLGQGLICDKCEHGQELDIAVDW